MHQLSVKDQIKVTYKANVIMYFSKICKICRILFLVIFIWKITENSILEIL